MQVSLSTYLKSFERIQLITLKKICWFSISLLLLNSLLYGYYRFNKFFYLKRPVGDESKFLNDIDSLNTPNGLSYDIVKNLSLTYTYLTQGLNYFVGDALISLRSLSLISGIILLVLICWACTTIFRRKLDVFIVWTLCFYFLIIQSYNFIGVNDGLLALFGFCAFWILKENKKKLKNSLLLALALALMITTRKMAIIFVLLIVITKVIYWESSYFKNLNFTSISVGVLIFLVLNSYSILNYSTLSFDDKVLHGDINWAQFDYLTAILIDKGEIKEGHHPNKETVDKFINSYGKESLPSSFTKMIYFDLRLTIKEFFKDFIITIKGFVRQLGLTIGLLFLIGILSFFKSDFKSKYEPIYFIFLSFTLLICFIVITNVQLRWFMSIMPIMMIISYREFLDFVEENQCKNLFYVFAITNSWLLFLFNIPFIYQNSI